MCDRLHVHLFPQGLVVRVEGGDLGLCSIQPLHHGGVELLQVVVAVTQLRYLVEHLLLSPAQTPSETHI